MKMQPSCVGPNSSVVLRRAPPVAALSTPSIAIPSFMRLPSTEGYFEVAAVRGARVIVDDTLPTVEYLAQWKDDSPDSWEAAASLSEDLIRDYEDRWWTACRKGDFETLASMLAGGRGLLAPAVDADQRSALHFAAGLGKADCVELLLEAGADPNQQDVQGYTPLHMAVGYMHTSSITELLKAGANPQLRDVNGQDAVRLLGRLRATMPLAMPTISQRLRLEEVANCVTDLLYEEAQVACVLQERRGFDGSRQVLVSWTDGHEDSWVADQDVSASLLQDYEEGMEFSPVQQVLDMVQVGTTRRFKIHWGDNYPDSWEPEEHVPADLAAATCPEGSAPAAPVELQHSN
eukprot:CAMPEP_0119102154 /NCGR_PEP_ID=MMETSP1180-20130426/1002_1 /TAXON_ID=3052 ORGANISM="Chlamydomonas cf sp, Strain CCMP681" /NCGR_SAMPLE_ID=MMETSP1180 /ASSEMBLY_ACC=CAM_ASM_000741 /LENGTH=346 /DNA_ID=CAMNT_0007086393 /DNA_START=181 /DNA_END=1221 /DNA_ORIENTATION=-